VFPVFLDLTARLAVVVGGGVVGRRKAASLLGAGATVRLVCLEPRPADESHPALEWRTGPYESRHLDGAALVFAAGPADVNAQVVQDAHSRGLWVQSASDPGAGDFINPSVVRRGKLVLAVGTSGAAPALARRIRSCLEQEFDSSFAEWVDLLAEWRAVILREEPEKRKEVLEGLTEWRWLEALRRDGPEATRDAIRAWLAERGIRDTL
jgi:precorrin-2 dehydrogenase/sirohydrochlorin ferrochelatase